MNTEEPGELQAPLKAHHGEEQRVATLFKLAERYCVIYQTLRADDHGEPAHERRLREGPFGPSITVKRQTKRRPIIEAHAPPHTWAADGQP